MAIERPRRRAGLAAAILWVAALAGGEVGQRLAGAGTAGAPAEEAPPPAPTLLTRVNCRSLEGPCDYRYALINPAAVAEPARTLVLFEAGEAEDRTSNGWRGERNGGSWRWEDSAGVPAGWTLGGFLLEAEGLPKVALAQVEAGGAVRSVPTLVPGPLPSSLGAAPELIGALRAQLDSLVAAGWIAPGPGRGLLDGRLRTILELLERNQRTEAMRRVRALVDEVGHLAPPGQVPPGRTPGGYRPLLGGATPIAPEVRDLFVATLRVALARLGAIR